jgi:hypothetical protein
MIKKYELINNKNIKHNGTFSAEFSLRSAVTFILINISAFFILLVIAFGLILLISNESTSLYGDHCDKNEDCKAEMNYVCNLGKCDCNTDTFYESASKGCGK